MVSCDGKVPDGYDLPWTSNPRVIPQYQDLGGVSFYVTAYDWALAFDERMKGLILSGDHEAIISYPKLGPSARLAVPTPEHYLPLLYVLAAQDESEGVGFFAERVTLGSMSMRSVRIG